MVVVGGEKEEDKDGVKLLLRRVRLWIGGGGRSPEGVGCVVVINNDYIC